MWSTPEHTYTGVDTAVESVQRFFYAWVRGEHGMSFIGYTSPYRRELLEAYLRSRHSRFRSTSEWGTEALSAREAAEEQHRAWEENARLMAPLRHGLPPVPSVEDFVIWRAVSEDIACIPRATVCG